MEDDARRVPPPAAQNADSVPQHDAVRPPPTLHRPMMHRKDGRIPLAQRHNGRPGLHTWTLLGQDELASVKITARLG